MTKGIYSCCKGDRLLMRTGKCVCRLMSTFACGEEEECGGNSIGDYVGNIEPCP